MKQETIEEVEFCHYSGLPSPAAYEESKQEILEENVKEIEKLFNKELI